jgi:hypothetical protein
MRRSIQRRLAPLLLLVGVLLPLNSCYRDSECTTCHFTLCLNNVPSDVTVSRIAYTIANGSKADVKAVRDHEPRTLHQEQGLIQANGGTIDLSNLGTYEMPCNDALLLSIEVFVEDPDCPSGLRKYTNGNYIPLMHLWSGNSACDQTYCIDFSSLNDKGCW